MRTLTGARRVPGTVFRAATLALVAWLAGCASSGSTAEDEEPRARRGVPTFLHVTNRNWMDMQIYAVRGSERRKLLSVTSMRTDSVAVPASLLRGTGFRLMADPIGRIRPYYSSAISLRRGQTVWWTLENWLPQSNLWVY